jgi:hypothetical protein
MGFGRKHKSFKYLEGARSVRREIKKIAGCAPSIANRAAASLFRENQCGISPRAV